MVVTACSDAPPSDTDAGGRTSDSALAFADLGDRRDRGAVDARLDGASLPPDGSSADQRSSSSDGSGPPPDGRRSPDQAPACSYSCAVSLGPGTTSCTGAVASVTIGSGQAVMRVDLSGFSRLELTATICSPRSWAINIGNSPTNNGGGGDGGQFANDSELQLVGSQLTVFGNQVGGTPTLLTDASFVPPSGCVQRTFMIGDGSLATPSPTHNLSSPYLFRINQPDSEGQPDALFYVGLNRVVSTTSNRTGSGVAAATICLR